MKTKIEKIGERTYSFGIMPATVAYEVEVALAEVIGEPLFKAIAGGGAAATDKEKLLDVSGVAIGMIASRARAANLLPTIKTVFENVRVDVGTGTAVPINIDSHFTGRPKELWQVFIIAIQVNFADFFDGLRFDLAGIPAASKSSQ